jgi:hypothetical protein
MIRFVPWSEVGTITVSPGDNVVEVGAFELAEGADTLWVRMTNTGTPGPWPWSYGILSFKTDEGQPLGSIKAYNSFNGEVFRLGVGLPPSMRAGVLTFEPRGFNMAWIKQGNPWTLKFEAQSGGPNLTSSMWERDPENGVITPKVQGDNLDMSPGWIKAKSLILTDGSGATDDREVPGYQQGFWTPLVPSLTSISTIASRNQWSRIGNSVWVSCYLSNMTAAGTSNTPVRVSGLPYLGTDVATGGSCMTRFCGVQAHSTYVDGPVGTLQFYESSTAAWETVTVGRVFNAGNQGQVFCEARFITDDTTWEPGNNASVT